MLQVGQNQGIVPFGVSLLHVPTGRPPNLRGRLQIHGGKIILADSVARANVHVMTRYHLRNVMTETLQTAPLLLQYNALIASTMKFLLSTSGHVSMGAVKKK